MQQVTRRLVVQVGLPNLEMPMEISKQGPKIYRLLYE